MNTAINIDANLAVLDATTLPTLDAVSSPAVAKAARRITRRVARRRFVTLSQHAAAVEHLRPLPEPGESIHGAMSGAYSGWQLATAVIEILDEPVDEMIVSTLGFNRQNCDSLIELLDAGSVRSVLLNVSNYFRHSDREIFTDIRRQLEERGQTVAVTRAHAKLLLFRTANRSIVVEMSANLRSSQNWEQFVISDDAGLFDFHHQWIQDLCSLNA